MEEPGAGVQEPVASRSGVGSLADGPSRTDAPPTSSSWDDPSGPGTAAVPVWRPVAAPPGPLHTPEPRSGLEEGDVVTSIDSDVVTSIDSKVITGADQLAVLIQGDRSGRSIRIGLYRGQRQLTLTSTLASSQPPGG